MHRSHILTATALLALTMGTACSDGLADKTFATGSNSVVTSSNARMLYTANEDAGTIGIVDLEQGVAFEGHAFDSVVTRIARAGDTVVATLRDERSVAFLIERDGELELDTVIEVGAEPFGVVASEDGERVYVSTSTAGQVVAIDVASRSVVDRFDVPNEPRWLALHPNGHMLYVGSFFHGTFSWIDTRSGKVESAALPVQQRHNFESDFDNGMIDLTNRITGDMSVAPNGDFVAVPMLSIDIDTPVDDPTGDEGTVDSSGYGSAGMGVSRFNPGVLVVPTGPEGTPKLARGRVVFAGAFSNNGIGMRSYISAAVVAPDSMTILGAMEASDVVLAIPAYTVESGDQGQGEFEFSSIELIASGDAPRGIAFTGKTEAWLHTGHDSSVANTGFEFVRDELAAKLSQQRKGNRHGDVDFMDEMPMDDGMGGTAEFFHSVSDTIRVEDPNNLLGIDDAERVQSILEGRALFFSATNASMAGSGAGVSCSTCHIDSRNDGLTWTFDGIGGRQTLSLAGDVTARPGTVTWTNGVESVAHEAKLTTSERMGGAGLTNTEALSLQSFVQWTRAIDHPLRNQATDAIARGQQIFERADVGCASCHNGTELSDGLSYDIAGLVGVRTPQLRGVAVSAPYLHDGRFATIEDVLSWSRTGAMGDTSMLSEAEIADLADYVKSL